MLLTKISPFATKTSFFTIFYTLIFISTNIEFSFYKYYYYLSVFLVSFFGIGIFGYFINDISDVEGDKIAGKNNIASKFSKTQQLFYCSLLLLIGFLPIVTTAPKTTSLLVVEVILLLLYSFPPFRLKEKGFIGIITDSTYAYFLPSLILLTYLESLFSVDIFFGYFLPLFGFILGIRNILNHQLEDYDNDRIANTKTFATENQNLAHSLKIVANIISVIIWEIALVYILLNNFPNVITTCFLVIGSVYLIRTILYFVYREEKYLAGLPEFDLIYYGLVVMTAFILVEGQYKYLFLSLFLFTPLVREKIQISFWYLGVRFYIFNRRILSFIVNYTLYYSFLLVGINLKERAKNRKKSITTKHSKNITQPIELQGKNVHGLWIGNELSLMELLTIKSFIRHGYTFHIWVYESLKNELPNECNVCDANEIIPFEKVFRYKYSSQFGTGKGSYAGFSDIFRYKLLYEKGGWWVDMDVTCLRPFDVEAPYFFRSHHDLLLVGNIMKVPKGSELMLRCYEEASRGVDANNRDWHKPIEILVNAVRELNLEQYIISNVSNTDEWHKIKPYVHTNKEVPNEWSFLHWCNEVWRTNGFNKNSPLYSSFFGQVLMEYRLIPSIPKTEWKKRDRKMKIRILIDKITDFI